MSSSYQSFVFTDADKEFKRKNYELALGLYEIAFQEGKPDKTSLRNYLSTVLILMNAKADLSKTNPLYIKLSEAKNIYTQQSKTVDMFRFIEPGYLESLESDNSIKYIHSSIDICEFDSKEVSDSQYYNLPRLNEIMKSSPEKIFARIISVQSFVIEEYLFLHYFRTFPKGNQNQQEFFFTTKFETFSKDIQDNQVFIQALEYNLIKLLWYYERNPDDGDKDEDEIDAALDEKLNSDGFNEFYNYDLENLGNTD